MLNQQTLIKQESKNEFKAWMIDDKMLVVIPSGNNVMSIMEITYILIFSRTLCIKITSEWSLTTIPELTRPALR